MSNNSSKKKKFGDNKAETWGDLKRIWGSDPVSNVGHFMVRKKNWIRAGVVGATAGLIKAGWMDPEMAVPIGFFATYFVPSIGMGLKVGPKVISKRYRKAAEIAGFKTNLAPKNQYVRENIDLIWDYVYSPDVNLVYTDAEKTEQAEKNQDLDQILWNTVKGLPQEVQWLLRVSNEEGKQVLVDAMKEAMPVTSGLEKTKEDLESTIKNALANPYDRHKQSVETGLKAINTLEDYLSTPLFAEGDTSLSGKFSGQSDLGFGAELGSQYYDNSVEQGDSFKKKAAARAAEIYQQMGWGVWAGLTSKILETDMGKLIIKTQNKYLNGGLSLPQRLNLQILKQTENQLNKLSSHTEERRIDSPRNKMSSAYDKFNGALIKVSEKALERVEKALDKMPLEEIEKAEKSLDLYAQTILMPGTENEDWVMDFQGLKEDIIEIRQISVSRTFGPTKERTDVMLQRRNRPLEKEAIDRRSEVDYEFLNPKNKVNLATELRRLGVEEEEIAEARSRMDYMTNQMKDFENFITLEQGRLNSTQMSKKERFEYVSQHADRLRDFIKERRNVPVDHFDSLVEVIEGELYYYKEGDLENGEVSKELWGEIKAYTNEVERESAQSIFSLPNARRLRAAKTAFFANYKGIRRKFDAMTENYLNKEEDAEYREEIFETLREAMNKSGKYDEMLESVRMHHVLTRFKADQERDVVYSLRDWDWVKPDGKARSVYRGAKSVLGKGVKKVVSRKSKSYEPQVTGKYRNFA